MRRQIYSVWLGSAAVVLVVALAGCGGGSDSDAGSNGTVTVTDSDTTDAFDSTETVESADTVGQGVEQTCEDIVEFLTLVREPADSIDDVRGAAAAASELASKASAETEEDFPMGAGEPRDSLRSIADGYETFASLLSELGLEPGPDVLQEPRLADVVEDIQLAETLGLAPWAEARCSADIQEQIQQGG